MASRGINKVILVGNLGQDPEVRYMPNGNAVTNITVATSDSWKDQQGQQQERTEWHRVVFFGKLAEIAGEYLRKGSQVYLEGKLQTRKWKDQSGADRYSTEIVVDMNGTMQMLGGRNQGGQGGQSGQGGNMGGYGAPQGGNQYNAPQQAAPAQQYNAPQQQPQQYNNAPQQSAPAYQQPQQNSGNAGYAPKPQQNSGYAAKPQQSAPAPQQAAPAQQPQQPQQQNYTPDLDDGWDDDIPF